MDSQVSNIIILLLNLHTAATGAAEQLLNGATRQCVQCSGTGSKGPGHLQTLPPSLCSQEAQKSSI